MLAYVLAALFVAALPVTARVGHPAPAPSGPACTAELLAASILAGSREAAGYRRRPVHAGPAGFPPLVVVATVPVRTVTVLAGVRRPAPTPLLEVAA